MSTLIKKVPGLVLSVGSLLRNFEYGEKKANV